MESLQPERKSLFFARSTCTALVGMMLANFGLSMPAQAQTAKRVIHVWVDPHYGSDSTAAGAPWFNPRCSGGGNGCIPAVQCKPNDVVLTNGPVLLHAPWPFKTINQPGGALSYIPTLPHAGIGAQWEYAIIHLLPGLYARDTAYGTAGSHNPDNGLQPNGESFPIHLPPRVSIQGTSALNTVFDVSSTSPNVAGPAFEFGAAGSTGVDTFIDSIAIFGADPTYVETVPPPKTFAAIALSPDEHSEPTISNCFLYGNGIGILVDAAWDDEPLVQHDGTKIFNNTIAFNHIGLWNGQTQAPGDLSIGVSKLILVNNIFDSSPETTTGTGVTYPMNWAYYAPILTPTNNACFEGVSISDLSVAGPPAVDTNAYEALRFNYITLRHPAVNLRITVPRGTSPGTPTHDISAYTRGIGVRRGILYIRDALTKPVFLTDAGGGAYFDSSPHDFRLSPAVAIASNGPVQQPSALNPLVNVGWGGTFPMTMANGLSVLNPPGYLTLGTADQNTWAFHNWNWDCEGYGNPRFQNHGSFYANNGAGIDIGADELGQLVAAGYRFATTHFMDVPSSPSPAYNQMDNKYLWFFGPPTALATAPTNVNLPVYRAVDHLASMPANYYTAGTPNKYPPWFSSWNFANATNYYFPTVADITPHLLDDPHPWWTPPLTLNLSNAANPLWQSCIAQFNIWLYSDPIFGRINPAGSYKGTGTSLQWLDVTWTMGAPAANLIQLFGVLPSFRLNAGSIGVYDAWCRGHRSGFPAATVDTFLPTYTGSPMVALRYCLEHYNRPPFTTAWTDTNLQSFLVLVQP